MAVFVSRRCAVAVAALLCLMVGRMLVATSTTIASPGEVRVAITGR